MMFDIIRTSNQLVNVPALLPTAGNVTSHRMADMNIVAQTKRCSRCGEIKDISEFNVDRHLKNGIKSECRVCHRQANRKFKAEHPESMKAAAKKYYHTHKEIEADRHRLWVKNNREKANSRNRRYYANHPEKKQEWKDNNPEKVKEINGVAKAKRRAQKRDSGGVGFSQKEWEEMKFQYNYRCAYCNQKEPLQIEHVIPLSKGGLHESSNIVPACKKCNTTKRSTSLLIWLYKRFIK